MHADARIYVLSINNCKTQTEVETHQTNKIVHDTSIWMFLFKHIFFQVYSIEKLLEGSPFLIKYLICPLS